MNKFYLNSTSLNKANIFKKISFYTLFFPFFSPYPISSDVQPFCYIVCSLIILFDKFIIKKEYFYIILFIFSFSIIFAFYINSDFDYNINRRFALFSSIIIIIFTLKYLPIISYVTLINILYLHILLMIFQLLFTDIFDNIFGLFINRITYYDGDSRGVHGLNSEPGGAAAVIACIYFSYCFKSLQLSIKNKVNYYVLLLVTIALFLTKSGLGLVLFSIIVIHFYFLFVNNYKILIFSLLTFYLFIFLGDNSEIYLSKNRSFELISTVLNDFENFIFTDGSISERIIGLTYGIFSLAYFPFGVGGGGYPFAANYVEFNHGLSNIFYSARPQLFDAVSMVGIYLAEFGLFFIFFLIGLVILFIPKFNLFLFPFIIAIFFIIFSFSLAFPVTWILLSICFLSKKFKFNSQ